MKNEDKRTKRNNRKIKKQIIFFTFMLTVVIYAFLFFVIPSGYYLISSESGFKAMRYFLLIFIVVFGMISFAFGYLYSQEIFLGVFKRLDKFCRSIIDGEKAGNLTFRKRDRFLFFAQTFNEMLAALNKKRLLGEEKEPEDKQE